MFVLSWCPFSSGLCAIGSSCCLCFVPAVCLHMCKEGIRWEDTGHPGPAEETVSVRFCFHLCFINSLLDCWDVCGFIWPEWITVRVLWWRQQKWVFPPDSDNKSYIKESDVLLLQTSNFHSTYWLTWFKATGVYVFFFLKTSSLVGIVCIRTIVPASSATTSKISASLGGISPRRWFWTTHHTPTRTMWAPQGSDSSFKSKRLHLIKMHSLMSFYLPALTASVYKPHKY